MTGERIKNYQLEELLGEGGMGVVYRAKDLNLNRMVAIKMLHPEMLHQPDLLKRFKNEAHVTARLSHPNIATLYNFFSEGDLHCLVMEFVNGKTLEQILDVHKKLSADECIRVLIQLLEGLEEAHENEILHRDIKPGNVMINQTGYVKLMDFGVARIESSARITRMNRVIGTLEYMAPELLTGAKPSRQSDLYSVGVAAYEMLFGCLPFISESDTDMMELIMKGKFSFPTEDRPQSLFRYKQIKSIIRKLMHKEASKRYQNCAEVLNELNKLGINGRVATTLLSEKKQDIPPATAEVKQNRAFIDYAEAVASKARNASAYLMPLFHKAKPITDRVFLKAADFFKTTEGKLIGGALVFAVVILIFSSLLSTPLVENSDRINDTPSETSDISSAADQLTQIGTGSNSSLTIPSERLDGSRPDNRNDEIPVRRNIVVPGGNAEEQAESTSEEEPTTPVRAAERGENLGKSEHQSSGGSQKNGLQAGTDNKESMETTVDGEENSGNARRQIEVVVSNLLLEGVFAETVSTATHSEGQYFYLKTTRDSYYNGYRVINAGARIRGVVNEVRTRGASRRASLSVKFESVEAVDGSWLPVTYPEYSDRGTGQVTFERGRTISRLRVESGQIQLEL